jgi:ankyrin repeat protein
MSHFDPTMFDMQHQTDFADLLDHTTITSEFGQYTQSTSGLGIANTIEPNPSQLVCQGDLLQPPPSFPSAQTTPNLPQQPTCSPRNHSPLLQPTGTNPMHLAAMRGFVPILEMLLAQGADVNEVDERGCTALHLAVEQGQEEAVRVLLKHGADFSAKVH